MTNIVEYSEKAIAVYGNTKPIKDKLKELGGRFNPHLKDGAGWVFSKSKREAVQQMISQTMGAVVTVMPEPPIYSKDYVSTEKPIPIASNNKGKTTKFTDIVVTGFMAGEYTMPNHKVEKFVKGLIKQKENFYKGKEIDDKYKMSITFKQL
jgi:Tfp pilus assembly pilus retraction ATPase PilT